MQNLNEVLNAFKQQTAKKENIIKTIPRNLTANKNGELVNVFEYVHKTGIQTMLRNEEPNYVIDKTNSNTIKSLFQYFTGNVEFCEQNNIDLNKGILLIGNVGSGKSLLMKVFKNYTANVLHCNSFRSYSSPEIIANVNMNGISYLNLFADNNDGYKAQPITAYIDDICSLESEQVNNYGTKIEVIERLITISYEKYTRYRKLTHFTSNIYPEKMLKFYNERVISRLIEMCNIITLESSDFRLK